MKTHTCSSNTNVLYFQGILLHSDGEIRPSGQGGGRETCRGSRCYHGVRAVPSPKPTLQQKQPD